MPVSKLSTLVASSGDHSIIGGDGWPDFEQRIAETPHDAKIRGLFLREVSRLAGPRVGLTEKRYLPFSLYPVREYMALILAAARVKYPSLPASRAVLEVGCGVYSLFASSLAGTAIFSVVNVDYSRICQLSPKAYSVTLEPGSARCTHSSDTDAIVELRKVYAFPEVFHPGIWLGAMDATRVTGTIEITRHSLSDVDFHLRWQRR